eukprot:TRINITY_DN22607_c0_g1_i1.p1 TRINITY_DN22607_c0_g1~~TRINITY_DN22607_c0_g1_i1.p1  ORF type:complete len:486 (-),score=217.62 TRINITY_DN22607_c0_g1_i1:46-1503(-)
MSYPIVSNPEATRVIQKRNTPQQATIIDNSTIARARDARTLSDTLNRMGSPTGSPSRTSRTLAMAADSPAKDNGLTRKQQIEAYEKTRKMNLTPSKSEKEKAMNRDAASADLELIRSKNTDEAKVLQSLTVAALSAAEREKQLRERIEKEMQEKEENQAYYEMMEVERLKALSIIEEKEKIRKEEQSKASIVLQQQLEEREEERKRQKEQQLREQQEVIAHQEKLKQEQIEKQLQKARVQQQVNKETVLINEQMRQNKERVAQAEKDADMRAAEYARQKAEKEKKEEEEKAEKQRRKEQEWGKMRAAQEKILDKRSELDELKAKRVAEQREKIWREEQREEMEKKYRAKTDFIVSNEKLLNQKQMIKQQEEMEKEQYAREIAECKAQIEQAIQEEKERFRENQKTTYVELSSQIATRSALANSQSKMAFVASQEDAAQMERDTEQRKQKFEQMKEQKLQELRDLGVPEKYLHEIKKAQFEMKEKW